MRVLVYAGPTLHRATAIDKVDLSDVIVLPPVKRGDVPRAIATGEPGVLAIVDGYFHLENLSVGHAEIRSALQAGWQVWGLSSMGAIRGCEMHHMGMKGYGVVFQMYRDDPDFRDDEVALLHEPNPPYRESTEPLVHIRVALDDLVERGVLAEAARAEILRELMDRWFGERNLPFVRDLVARHAPGRDDEIMAWIRGFDRFRVKALDLIGFLRDKPWRT